MTSRPRAIVLRAAGANCDRESVHALELAGFAAERVHLLALIDTPARLDEADLLMLPGGFTYGDDVAAGKILANQLIHHLAEPLNRFVEAGKLVLGVCNGFQVLLRCGLLPWGRVDVGQAGRDATLGWNDSGRFIDRWVGLRAEASPCVFLPDGEELALPIAHGEGKFVPRDEATMARLRDGGQVALRYAGGNPNGSVDDVAGLCDPTGRILGLMPRPERFVDLSQHPTWTRGGVDRPDGLTVFRRAAEHLA
jgi:phosphoribosylformylglycinamidine synthase